MTTEKRIYLQHARGHQPAVGLYDGPTHREHWNCNTERAARMQAREIQARYPDAIIGRMERI